MTSAGKLRNNKASSTKKYSTQQGITYIEIILVVTILAIVAVTAIPNSSPTDSRKLDLATEEVAQAIRFARLESIRNDSPYGVYFNKSTDAVKVYRLSGGNAVYDVHHPLTKKLYTLNLKTDGATNNVRLSNNIITFHGLGGNKQYLGFSKQGIPKSYSGGTNYMLNQAVITLSYAGLTRAINVSPMVGRVSF